METRLGAGGGAEGAAFFPMSLPPPLVLFSICPKHTPWAEILDSELTSGETQRKTLKDSEHQPQPALVSRNEVTVFPVTLGWTDHKQGRQQISEKRI